MRKTAGICLTALFAALAGGTAAVAQPSANDDACFLTGSLGLDRNGSSTDTDQYGDYKGLSGVIRCGDTVSPPEAASPPPA